MYLNVRALVWHSQNQSSILALPWVGMVLIEIQCVGTQLRDHAATHHRYLSQLSDHLDDLRIWVLFPFFSIEEKKSFPVLLSKPLGRAVPGSPSPHVALLHINRLKQEWPTTFDTAPKGTQKWPLPDFRMYSFSWMTLSHFFTLSTLSLSVCLSLWQATHRSHHWRSEGGKECSFCVDSMTLGKRLKPASPVWVF